MATKVINEKYLKIKGENQYLKIRLYYSLGGMNYFNYKQEARGFYLSVSPVKREGHLESYVAFSGTKYCVHPCNRFSKKAAEQAAEEAKTVEKDLINFVLKENALELEE